MQFDVEKFISPLIESQFPSFYREEGPNFILFVKAYYEWMEDYYSVITTSSNTSFTIDDKITGSTSGAEGIVVDVIDSKKLYVKVLFPEFIAGENITNGLLTDNIKSVSTSAGVTLEGRNIFNYRDIDNTPSNNIEDFLSHFQQKYLYGIPYNVIANKRLLLKHIFDVYRSKGSLQCYKLLFRLIYNEDMDIYLPGYDLLKPSDGTWIQPRYLEVTESDLLNTYVGKKVTGLSSGTTAIVESFIKEPVNKNIICTVNLSNILPKNGDFIIGEKIVLADVETSETDKNIAPKVVGSLDYLEMTNGGQDFVIGDSLKIAHRDIVSGNVVSNGIDGIVRVTDLQRFYGSLYFRIVNGGFGYSANSLTFVYPFSNNIVTDTPTLDASFKVGGIAYAQKVDYNTDIIVNYYTKTIDSVSYNFPKDQSGNNSSTLASVLSYGNNYFGSISSLRNIITGNNYSHDAYANAASTLLSLPLPGTITYSNTSKTITGVGTNFTELFSNEDFIAIKSKIGFDYTQEYIPIKEVANDTSIILYGKPKYNSSSTTEYRIMPPVLLSQLAVYEPVMQAGYSYTHSFNANISATPSYGSNIIKNVTKVNSGKGYQEGEKVFIYLTGGVANLSVIASGSNYVNNESLVFSGTEASRLAEGYIITNSNGNITDAIISNPGSGYNINPVVSVKSNTGIGGAIISNGLSEFNTYAKAEGIVRKTGLGHGKGYWSSTRGLLNSDKYIQDSHYYQDFSYQINVPVTLNKYKEVLYNTFHTAGNELFSKYQKIISETELLNIDYESTPEFILADESVNNLTDELDEILEQEYSFKISPEITLITNDLQNLIADENGNILQQEIII